MEINKSPFESVRSSVDSAEPFISDLELALKPNNDMGNADRLMTRFGRDMIFVRNVGWHWFDGARWDFENGESKVHIASQDTAAAIRNEADALLEHDKKYEKLASALRTFAVKTGDTSRIRGMMAQAEPRLTHGIAEMNTNPWLLNCVNGTLDLAALRDATKEPLSPHRRHDYITRLAPVTYDPQADCPLWRSFLRDILPDDDVRLFIQRWMGYNLTGDTGEQFVVLLHGQGANGKSTIVDVMSHLCGDYSMTINFSSLLYDDRKRGSEASPDLARLPGARMVVAAEPELGARFSESQLKTMTGGDKMTVRHLNRDFFEFTPTFKLTLSFNNKPVVRGQDEGVWRRILLVPFERIIPPDKRDPHLKYKLRNELSGILNWALDGLRLYYERGLSPPDAVVAATRSYRDDSDPVGQFVSSCIERLPGSAVNAKDVYDAYKLWCSANAVEPVNSNLFGRMMTEKGFEREKVGIVMYRSVRICDDMRAQLDARNVHRGFDD